MKEQAFVWRLLQGRLPTLVNLFARGVAVQSNTLCFFCKEASETVLDHLFFGCTILCHVYGLTGFSSGGYLQLYTRMEANTLNSSKV